MPSYIDSFGLSQVEDGRITQHLTNQASTFFPNTWITPHYDSLNDHHDAFSGVVVINACVERKNDYPMTPKLSKWLDDFGYREYIPVCNVNYGRKVCRDLSVRMKEHNLIVQAVVHPKKTVTGMMMLEAAVARAVTDVNSITNIQNTISKCAGVRFNDLTEAISVFNKEQLAMYKRIRGGKKLNEIYKKCKKEIGSRTLSQIKIGVMASRNDKHKEIFKKDPTSLCDWVQQSFFLATNTLPIIPVPTSTYQGPFIALPAGYDKTRYYSAMMDGYADLNANLQHMSKKSGAAFAAFCTIQSNGSLAISEVIRVIAADGWAKAKSDFSVRHKGSLWETLIAVAEENRVSKIGSCTKSRMQINNCGDVFQFEFYAEDILQRFGEISDRDDDDMIDRWVVSTLKYMEKNYTHVGPLTGLMFLQLSALIGVLPLKIATIGHVQGTSAGPGKLLRLASSTNQPLSTTVLFRKLHEKFRGVWGPRFTSGYLENVLCELFKELQESSGYKKHFTMESIKSLLGEKKNSPQRDVIAIYSHRGLNKCIPPMFLLNIEENGDCNLHMQTFNVNNTNEDVELGTSFVVTSFQDPSLESYYRL